MSTAAAKGLEGEAAPSYVGGAEQRLSGIYAQALLDAASRKGDLDETLAELKGLLELVPGSANPFGSFVDNPLATRDVISGVIDRSFQGKSSESVINFLHVLNDHGRLSLLPHIAKAFERLVDQRKGRIAVHVRSATPLDPAARSELEQVLRGALGKEPVLHGSVDPELIGGLVVRVGDRVWDGSLSWQIRRLQEQLMERGNHAIQSGRDRFRTDR
ncbi:MAG: ATP synthase F1 subunit delta [Planctomycetes bacterium]|nr:ATP synthase F1 subunit delta [Planctomycetota bacterium]